MILAQRIAIELVPRTPAAAAAHTLSGQGPHTLTGQVPHILVQLIGLVLRTPGLAQLAPLSAALRRIDLVVAQRNRWLLGRRMLVPRTSSVAAEPHIAFAAARMPFEAGHMLQEQHNSPELLHR